jgi:hypothetical protein
MLRRSLHRYVSLDYSESRLRFQRRCFWKIRLYCEPDALC